MNRHRIIICFGLLIINCFSTFSIDYQDRIDSVNVRKTFFYNLNYEKNLRTEFSYVIDNIGVFYNKKDRYYEIQFYPVTQGKFNFYTYGSMKYIFNNNNELSIVMVYYQSNNSSFLLFDRSRKNKFDLYLFDQIYRRNLTYYFDFESLKYLPFNAFLSLLNANKIDTEVLISENDRDTKTTFINKIIRPALGINYVDDGATDEFGKYVYISSGINQKPTDQGVNCSGFLKMVAENYIRLKDDDFTYLNLTDLKQTTIKDRNNLSYIKFDPEFNPLFGYEWTQNVINQINSYYNYHYIKAEEIQNDEYVPYYKFEGFKIADFKHILFRDQKKNNAYFYIVVFNKLRNEIPIIPIFYHIALIVPYFFEHNFYLRIFESSAETDFTGLLRRHQNEKVIIFKIPVPLSYL